MKAYYIFRNDHQEGPFSLEALKFAGLAEHHLVWYEGLGNWTKASELAELKSLFQPVAPAPPEPPMTIAEKLGAMQQAGTPAPATPAPAPFIMQPRPAPATGSRFWIVLLLFAGALAAYYYYETRPVEMTPPPKPALASAPERDARVAIRELVKAEVQGFKAKKAPGGITNLKIQLDNTSAYELEAVKVRVDYLKSSGLVWKSEYLNFRNVRPKTAPVLKAPDSYSGTEVRAEVVRIQSKALGL